MNYADFSWYTGNLTWLKDRTIFLTKAGSHAYGTNTPTSDVDLRGICIAPRQYYFGFKSVFEQAVVNGDPDVTIFELRKFMSLAADCNPNIIELLFTDPGDWIIARKTFQTWLYDSRYNFLTKRAKYTFSGYAVSQLKRIRTHRHWLLNPPTHEPTRAEFGLPEQMLVQKDQLQTAMAKVDKEMSKLGGMGLNSVEQDEHVANVVAALGFETNFAMVLIQERRYNAARRNWDQYQNWKSERNQARSELEIKHGYDTKHAMHLVRLMRMAKEILTEGEVRVKRPDAEELLAIRNGAWTYDQLAEWADGQEAELEKLYQNSKLPHSPDIALLEGICSIAAKEWL